MTETEALMLTIWRLFHEEKLNTNEIARRLEMEESSVEALLHSARGWRDG